ncbi:MAG: protein translocase subunit SecF [Rhodospirillales bacterium]|nr:protein translocase subunit SecF [Alphaproteobacteria bacterium]MCB9981307.1 protein translocase subunit SecF [Rhodospirillales bacterium]
MKGIRLVPEETNFNFIGLRFLAYALSAALVLGSIGLAVQRGLNFGIDFTGGTVIEVRTPEMPDLAELRALLNDLDLGAITLQEFGSPEDLLIRLPEQKGGIEVQQMAIEDVREALNDIYADAGEVDYRRTEFVGPQVGSELKKQGLMAVLFSLAGILAYVWFRFEWQFGVASIIALAHDAIVTIGLFALTQMEFNLSTVAAILMIAGYSINDTVIVFDRIRENLRKFKKMPLPELFNKSVNEMLGRTLMTSGTTLLALIALYVFGGEVIQGFIYALIFGIVVGTYSSVFVAAPVLLNTGLKRGEIQNGDAAPQKA